MQLYNQLLSVVHVCEPGGLSISSIFGLSIICNTACVALLLCFTLWTSHFAIFLQVKPALPALAGLIHSNDEEVLTDACWALSYLSDGTNDKIQAVIEAGVCPRLVELLL